MSNSQTQISTNKNDYIELQDKKIDETRINLTKEDNRKILPEEVKNLRFILSNYSQITKYSWESDGDKIIAGEGTENKVMFTREEKKILKYLLLKELPNKYRSKFWLIASGAKREILNNRNYYTNLSQNFPDYIPSPYENQIEMDLHRTFPGDPYFEKEDNVKKLKNILLAYSRRNISIGYCQGFNFIEEAFWVFVQLIEHILPINYYSELAGIMVDCSILIKLIKIYLPSLYNHLIEIGYELSLNNILYKWFVSVFIQNLSSELSFIIWDLLFLEGNIVMFKSALGILKIIKKSVLCKDSLEDINEAFDEGTKHLNDRKTLIYYLVVRKFEFDIDFICKNRGIFQPAILENIIKNNENKIRYKNRLENLKSLNKDENSKQITEESDFSGHILRRASFVKNVVECFREWPLCIYDNNYKYDVISFLVFRVKDPPEIIESYFEPRGLLSHNNITCSNSSTSIHENFISYNKNCSQNNENESNKRRKSSSGDGFYKVYIENLKDTPITLSHYSKNNIYNNTEGNNLDSINRYDNFEYKKKIYKDLLIERRPHFCPIKENINIKFDRDSKNNLLDEDLPEIIFNAEYKLEDSYVKKTHLSFMQDLNSKEDGIISESNIISQSIIRPSYVFFESISKDEMNYSKILKNLNNDLSSDEMKMFESFKPKQLLELDEYVIEDNPYQVNNERK